MVSSSGLIQTPMKHHFRIFALLILVREDSGWRTVWLGRHPVEKISMGPKGKLRRFRNPLFECKSRSLPDCILNTIECSDESLVQRTSMSSLMGARHDRKAISGIVLIVLTINTPKIELQRLRAQIDGAACYFDVGSSYPGRAEAPKGEGVHLLKGIVSWVKYVVRQYV